MKIKKLVDFLAKDANGESQSPYMTEDGAISVTPQGEEEKVVYIDNSKLETAYEHSDHNQLISGKTQWSDQFIGDILVEKGRLTPEDVERTINYQQSEGLYFGEAAVALKLVNQDDILQALSIQFGYAYGSDRNRLSPSLVMANAPFGEQAEEFRTIRSHLQRSWLSPETKTLAVVSSEGQEGRSYVAANLALSFFAVRPFDIVD